jgi:hypothetical protein
MKNVSVRAALTSAIGSIEYTVQHLGRIEHGESRDTVANVRAQLTATANDLLILRARVTGAEAQPAREARSGNRD